MADDSRKTSKKESASATLASGSTTVTTLMDLREEETLSIEWLKVEYADGGTTAGTVDMYDEPDGTASGDLNDLIDKFQVTAGQRQEYTPVYEDVEDDIVLEGDGNFDDEVTVTVGGYIVTG